MAESPDDRVLMTHAEASEKDDAGKFIPVEVSRHEYESVWKAVGWKLQATKKEGN